MVRIYLTRHGQNVDNLNGILNGHRDEPLTELGIQQAKITAQHILEKDLTINHVYSSPLLRAKVTAEIITTELHLPPATVVSELIERNFGVMTGKLISQISELCSPDILQTATITYFLTPDGGETFPEVMERASSVIRFVQETHATGSVLLVTHGDIGKMLYAAYYNLDWKEVLINFHFGNCEVLLLSEDSPADEVHVFEQEQHNH